MSSPANTVKAGSSQETATTNDLRQNDGDDDEPMGDGGYTGAELEEMAKRGFEQVKTDKFNFFGTFYEHKLGDEFDEETKGLKIQSCIENDLERYRKEIGVPPSDMPLKEIEITDETGKTVKRKQTSEEAKAEWCVDRLISIKRKVLCKDALDDYSDRYRKQIEEKSKLGQGKRLKAWEKSNTPLLNPGNPKDLEHILAMLEAEEDLLEDLEDRPEDMTDTEWSLRKWEQIQKERENSQDEDKTRQEQLEEGAKAAAPDGTFSELDKTIMTLKENIPGSIRDIHKTMCIVMFQWWDSTQSTQDMANFRICSERLDRLPDAAMYRVAPTEISLYMELLKKALLECKAGASQEDLVTLAGITITLTNKLRKSGLDLNMVLGRDPLRQIFRHLFSDDIETLRPLCEQLRLAYLKPRKEHTAIYSPIDTILVSLVGSDGANIRYEGLEICLEQIRKVNERIGEQNKVYGVQFTDHQIPTNDLEAAIRLNKAGRVDEVRYQVARFAHKMALLGVPHSVELKSSSALSGCEVNQKEILHEVLGISVDGDRQYTSMVQNVTALIRSPHSSEYAGVPMETVAWGKIRNSYFYINQYGPQNATIYRRERHQSDDWAREHGNIAGPSEYEVTSKLNRPGEWKETDMSTLKYGKRHVLGLYGVAYAVPRSAEDPLEPLEPYQRSSSKSRRDDVYVLVGWDFELTQKDPVLKWETRSRVLDLWKEDADPSIYEAASESQERFEAWKRGELESRDTSLQPLAQSASDRFRYKSPGSKAPVSKVFPPQGMPEELDSSDGDDAAALGSHYRTRVGPQTGATEAAHSNSQMRPSIESTNRKQPASERVRNKNHSHVDYNDESDESSAESLDELARGSHWKQRSTRSPSSECHEEPQTRVSNRKGHGQGKRGQKAGHASPQEIRDEYNRLVPLHKTRDGVFWIMGRRFGSDWMQKMDRG